MLEMLFRNFVASGNLSVKMKYIYIYIFKAISFVLHTPVALNRYRSLQNRELIDIIPAYLLNLTALFTVITDTDVDAERSIPSLGICRSLRLSPYFLSALLVSRKRLKTTEYIKLCIHCP